METMAEAEDWSTPAQSGIAIKKESKAHRHRVPELATIQEAFPGSSIRESHKPPVAQVLPHTTPFNIHSSTLPGTTARNKRYVEGAQGRKQLFVATDKKKESSRWNNLESLPGSTNGISPQGGLNPDLSFAVLNMEDTMNQSHMYVDSELRRIMGSPVRGNQGHRSTTPHVSPNSYTNQYQNAPVNISNSHEYRSHSNVASHYGTSSSTQSSDMYTPMNYAGYPRSHDLNDWQRIQHQQLQAQLDQLQITSQTLSTGLPAYNSSSLMGNTMPNNTIGLGGTLGGVGFHDDLGKLEGLIRAKESILHEKNMVIERQKLEISHFQNQRREIELQERARLYPRPVDHSDKLLVKVQECEYEIATSKALIAEITAVKDAEIDKITKKLGETEYKLQRLQEKSQGADQDRERELEEVKRKLAEKEKYTEGLKEKYTKTREKYDRFKKKYGGMERYMEKLPTVEEQTKCNEMIKNLRDKEGLLKERIAQLEVSQREARQCIKTKDLEITTLETKEGDLQLQVKSLEEEACKLQTALGVASDEVSQSMRLYNKGEVEKLRKDKEKYKQEATQLKQVIESKHQQLRKLQSRHQKSTYNLEERLKQEEDTMVALREALKAKEDELRAYKVSTRDLAAQSQELYDHNLSLQEQKETLERIASTEHLNGSQKLLRELSGCVKDLHSLVQVCEHTMEGQEPNVSALLGLRASSCLSELEEEDSSPSLDTIKGRLKQVRKIRADIDRMRGLLQDKYAQDIGNNCITQ